MTPLTIALAVAFVLLIVAVWATFAEITLRGQLRDTLAMYHAALAGQKGTACVDGRVRHWYTKKGGITSPTCVRCGHPRYVAPVKTTEGEVA